MLIQIVGVQKCHSKLHLKWQWISQLHFIVANFYLGQEYVQYSVLVTKEICPETNNILHLDEIHKTHFTLSPFYVGNDCNNDLTIVLNVTTYIIIMGWADCNCWLLSAHTTGIKFKFTLDIGGRFCSSKNFWLNLD